MTISDDDLLSRVREHFKAALPRKIAVAVSGGGDSVALLVLLHQICASDGVEIQAATVDHGLRPESAAEAKSVTELCNRLGIQHTILSWRDWDGTGNLQDQARRARYDLLTSWAKSVGISVLAVGHTADDQAETVLMRLSRASGVSGLAGMPSARTFNGVSLIRPLLGCRRDELRAFLARQGVVWVDDPTNEDERFERIRARKVLSELETLGVGTQVLADVAQNMLRAREALDWYTFLAARDLVTVQAGCLVMDPRRFRTLPEEIARGLLLHGLRWIGGEEYPPRRRAMLDLLEKARTGQSGTLAGCRLFSHSGAIWLAREFNAVKTLATPVSDVWDRRWVIDGQNSADHEIRALGPYGVAICNPEREKYPPRAVLEASPSVWTGDRLVSAPLAGYGWGWDVELVGGSEDFFAMILSH